MYRCAIAGALLLGAPAAAYSEPASNRTVVETSDLNLADPADRARLSRRIVAACGEVSNTDVASRNAVRTCRSEAWAKAMNRAHTPGHANGAQAGK